MEAAVADEALGESSLGLSLSAADGAAVLALVNYPGTSAVVLDDDVGLDTRAAKNIIAARDGADGLELTNDDRLFASIAALDVVPYVGDLAFERLVKFAKAHPAPAEVRVENVSFAGWQAETAVWGANQAPAGTLNGLLDNRAAANLIAGRPYTSVAQIGAVALIGPSALQALRGQSRPWWRAMRNAPVEPQVPATLAGTFDGVAFDEATATKALRLANDSAREVMVANGVPAAPAAAIVGNRPYVSVAQIAAVAGVGTATMLALHRWAAGGPAADPVAELQATLAPLTEGLWMPSETDASFAFVSSRNIGGAAIDEALIRATLTAQHDALLPTVMWVDADQVPLASKTQVEVRDGAAFFNHIIAGADENDPDSLARAARFAALRDALGAKLTDFKVIRFGRISISTFIVGRTADGSIAGLLTGQVET
ncbi:MAG: hypothetical protein JNK82_20815 [Myxococcaceae bacterium]|nr:hypothetical protein [Myxococcaceae bacterium]